MRQFICWLLIFSLGVQYSLISEAKTSTTSELSKIQILLNSGNIDTDTNFKSITERLHGVAVKNIKVAYFKLKDAVIEELDTLKLEYKGKELISRVDADFSMQDIDLLSYQLIATVMVVRDCSINSGLAGVELQDVLLNYCDSLLTVSNIGSIQETTWGRTDIVGLISLRSIDDVLKNMGEYERADEIKSTADNLYSQYSKNVKQEQSSIFCTLNDTGYKGESFNTPVLDAFTWKNCITSLYGNRDMKGEQNFHTGIDIGAKAGEQIRSVKDGVVLRVVHGDTGYGNHVYIRHSDCITMYAHCSEVLVQEGQHVDADTVIALVGATGWATGNHLHFELVSGGKQVDPIKYIISD